MVELLSLTLAQQKKALSWQCRRGIKEIEVLLLPFLEDHYEQESQEVREAFIKLLAEADLDLFEWFTRRDEPEDPQLTWIVNVVLERLSARA